jgi:hypothetical protein
VLKRVYPLEWALAPYQWGLRECNWQGDRRPQHPVKGGSGAGFFAFFRVGHNILSLKDKWHGVVVSHAKFSLDELKVALYKYC